MEARFLNFHDEEHFSDLSLQLEDQHHILGESQSSLDRAVDNDFDYIENFEFNSNDALWETEQELNGDIAVLPVSGVSTVFPKMENIKEDYAKVLTDWNEHIGYLQASEIEEDLNFAMNLPINADFVDESIFEDPSEIDENSKSPVKKEPQTAVDNSVNYHDVHNYAVSRLSESDQSEKEIDVVGLDSVDDVNPIFDSVHVGRQHATTPSKNSSKALGKLTIKIKRETCEIVVKDEPIDYVESYSPKTETEEFSKSIKRKGRNAKKQKGEPPNKRGRKPNKPVREAPAKAPKKLKQQLRVEEIVEETSGSSSVPSSSKKPPVLEAGDVKSLLEQFEATEAAEANAQLHDTSLHAPTQQSPPKSMTVKSTLPPEKSVNSHGSKIHQDIRDSLPKEVIDRIKASARKKVIPVIPAIPNIKAGARSNGTRMQEAAATLSRNKLLKLVSNSNANSVCGRIDGSVQLDHDYCSNSSSMINSSVSSRASNCSDSGNSEYDTPISDGDQLTVSLDESNKQSDGCCYGKGPTAKPTGGHKALGAARKNWSDSGSKKDSGLESGDVSDASEEQQPTSSTAKSKKALLNNVEKKTTVSIQQANNLINVNSQNVSVLNKSVGSSSVSKPVYEMKIQSALATSILQLRKGVLTKTKTFDGHKPQQMVSVLKNPPAATTPQKVLSTSYKESIVTTTNSSNDQVQNIIIQETTELDLCDMSEKKPPRRKLNLAEYRSRREQTRSDGSRTNSPVQPMALVYIHHVSTNTEPMWSEREIVSILKPKAEIEEDKMRPKQPTRDRGVQTMESVFGSYRKMHKSVEKQKLLKEKQLRIKQKEEKVRAPRPEKVNVQTQVQEKPLEQQQEKEQEQQKEKEQVPVKESMQVPHQEEEMIKIKEEPTQEKDEQVQTKEMQVQKQEKSEVAVQVDESEAEQKTINVNDTLAVDTVVASIKEEPLESGEIVESGEITNDDVVNINVADSVDEKNKVDKEDKDSETVSKDRKQRNYRRTRTSSSSSRSRSRSRGRSRRSRRSRSRSSRSHSSRSSRSSDSSHSRSRSRSHSARRRHTRHRRRKISHRRSSVSSNSSWSSRSRSRSRYRSHSSSSARSRSSRSRSRSSRYSSCSRSSSRSYSGRSRHRRGKSRDRKRSYNRHGHHSSSSSHGYNDWRRSPSYRRPYDEWYVKEKQRQVEERRVVYVGRLKEGITKAELRRRFEVFGPVVDISLHFREHGHNYGFVTFAYKNDAYEAVEHGNDDPTLPRYDLCFGGRRAFCKVKYADLDGAASNSLSNPRGIYKPEEENTFDLLLKEAQAKLRKRKA